MSGTYLEKSWEVVAGFHFFLSSLLAGEHYCGQGLSVLNFPHPCLYLRSESGFYFQELKCTQVFWSLCLSSLAWGQGQLNG